MKIDAGRVRARSGQSLVELTLLLPILLIMLLGALNLGLAIRAHLQLSQVAQQAAQILVHHPDYADPTGNYSTMLSYINSLSSYQIAPGQLQVTVGTSTEPSGLSCTLANKCVQQDTVTIGYRFPLIFPMAGKLSVGLLQSGSVNLGTIESTIAATDPVTNTSLSCASTSTTSCQVNGVTVTTGANQHVITWTRPVEAEPAPTGISLPIPEYCITVYYTDGGGSFLPHNLGCFLGPTPGSTSWPNTSNLYFVDTTDYTSLVQDPTKLGVGQKGIYYSVVAQQLNGVQSAASDKVNQ